jgi:hypothetical protein
MTLCIMVLPTGVTALTSNNTRCYDEPLGGCFNYNKMSWEWTCRWMSLLPQGGTGVVGVQYFHRMTMWWTYRRHLMTLCIMVLPLILFVVIKQIIHWLNPTATLLQ